MLFEVNKNVKKLFGEIAVLKNKLKETKDLVKVLKNYLTETNNELKIVKIMNERMKQSVNMQAYQMDELNLYGRRENIRIHGVAEENITAKMMEKR